MRCLLVAGALALAGCATLTDAQQLGRSLCKLNQTAHGNAAEVAVCDSLAAIDDWTNVANLAAAKPDVTAAKQALTADSRSALAMPCVPLTEPKPATSGGEQTAVGK